MTRYLDQLIERATAQAEVAAGAPLAWVAANHGPVVHTLEDVFPNSTRMPPWTAEEDAFLTQNLGWLSLEEMAAQLGRTPVAVELRWKRDLGLPAPSKHPDWLTANQVAKTLGIDGHAVIHLIERGLLPARLLPGERRIRVVHRLTLKRWVVNPTNWIYFLGSIKDTRRISDEPLRRLVERQKPRWQDEWWTPGQVARYHGLANSNLVNLYIRTGRLPAVKWGNWFILRSAATQPDLVFYTGKGGARASAYERLWSDDGDAFLILAYAVGGWTGDIAGRMKLSPARVRHRRNVLHQTGRMGPLIQQYGLKVNYRPETGQLLADWRGYRHRFPGLAAAVARFKRGQPRAADLKVVTGLLQTWADWYAVNEAQRQLAYNLAHAANATEAYLRRVYQELCAWGIDPLGVGEAGDVHR